MNAQLLQAPTLGFLIQRGGEEGPGQAGLLPPPVLLTFLLSNPGHQEGRNLGPVYFSTDSVSLCTPRPRDRASRCPTGRPAALLETLGARPSNPLCTQADRTEGTCPSLWPVGNRTWCSSLPVGEAAPRVRSWGHGSFP